MVMLWVMLELLLVVVSVHVVSVTWRRRGGRLTSLLSANCSVSQGAGIAIGDEGRLGLDGYVWWHAPAPAMAHGPDRHHPWCERHSWWSTSR